MGAASRHSVTDRQTDMLIAQIYWFRLHSTKNNDIYQ